MCFGLNILGGGTKAAKLQAKATMDSANMVAASDREAARGNLLAMSTQIAQKRAADGAAELLSTPQEKATVVLSPETDAPEVDPLTNKRKTRRGEFFSAARSGINI